MFALLCVFWRLNIFYLGVLSGCYSSAATLEMQITPKVLGENLQPSSFRYQTSTGETFSITRVSYLVSDFGLQRNDGKWLEMTNAVAWMDFEQNRDSIWLPEIPAGEFRAVRFSVGLGTNLNHADVAKFPAGHPLNPNVNGLHWSWQGGYIFMALEGLWRNPAGEGLLGGILIVVGLGSAVLCSVFGAILFGPKGGLIGAVIGLGIARITNVDIRRGLAQSRGLLGQEIQLASKYQDKPENYDQAAVSYYNWLTTVREFSVPKKLPSFLRDYRNASTRNTELRECLFDALLLQTVQRETVEQQVFVLAFTGSAKQEAILQAYLDWYVPKVHSIYSDAKKRIISGVRSAHTAGVDMLGVDLRLPSVGSFLRRIQQGSGFDSDMCALSLKSPAYCGQIAMSLKSLNLPEAEHIAEVLSSQSGSLARSVGEALAKKPAGKLTDLSTILICLVPAWGLAMMLGGACAFATDWPAAVAGIKIKIVGWTIMILGASSPVTGLALIPAALREKRRYQQISKILSQTNTGGR